MIFLFKMLWTLMPVSGWTLNAKVNKNTTSFWETFNALNLKLSRANHLVINGHWPLGLKESQGASHPYLKGLGISRSPKERVALEINIFKKKYHIFFYVNKRKVRLQTYDRFSKQVLFWLYLSQLSWSLDSALAGTSWM